LSFKDFLNEEISFKVPKPLKGNITINLKDYSNIIKESALDGKKTIIRRLQEKGEVPVYCESSRKFFMANLGGKKVKARELKSREDKELSGVLFNSMLMNEHKNGSEESLNELTSMKLTWEAPDIIYRYKDEYGKNISFKKD
jgi:dihydropteroate synthase